MQASKTLRAELESKKNLNPLYSGALLNEIVLI